jgi:hypothetical protein
VGNVPLAGARLAVAAGADAVTIDGLPSHVRAAYPDDAEHDPHRR